MSLRQADSAMGAAVAAFEAICPPAPKVEPDAQLFALERMMEVSKLSVLESRLSVHQAKLAEIRTERALMEVRYRVNLRRIDLDLPQLGEEKDGDV